MHHPDLRKDILDVELRDLPKNIDVLWASPPCTTFSVASLRHYWFEGKPKHWKTYIGLAIVMKTLFLIEELKPKYWFIENPRGMLRKQEFMMPLHRKTVTYCQYGLDYMKPTDIWTNFIDWKSRKPCKAGSDCHTEARRGDKKGVQGIWEGGVNNVRTKGSNLNRSQMRAVIPSDLFKEIFEQIEKVI